LANARADTGGKYQLLVWAFRTAATVINQLFSSLFLGFQVTVISEYSRLVCVGDRKLSCKRQKYIRGDKGRCLQKRSGTAEGLQAHRRPYCKDSVRWAISWNALLYSRDTSHAVAALRSTSSCSLESPTPSKQHTYICKTSMLVIHLYNEFLKVYTVTNCLEGSSVPMVIN